MKAEKIYRTVFNRNYDGQIIDFEYIDKERVLIIDSFNDDQVELYCYEDSFTTEDGDVICSIKEMMNFNKFNELNTCFECNGKGHIDVRMECDKPASMCCGACTETIKCECLILYPF